MKHFIITGKSVPSKKNNKQIFYTKGKNGKKGRVVVTSSDNYKAWNEEAIVQIKLQQKGFYTKKCMMALVFYHGDMRKRDADNGTNSVFDTFKNAAIIEDDNRFVILNHFVFNREDFDNPRVEVFLFDPEEPIYIPGVARVIFEEPEFELHA